MVGQQDGDVAEGPRLAVAFHVRPPATRRQADGVLVRGVVIELELLQPFRHFDALLPLVVVRSCGHASIRDVREGKQIQEYLSVAVDAVLGNDVPWKYRTSVRVRDRNQPAALVHGLRVIALALQLSRNRYPGYAGGHLDSP